MASANTHVTVKLSEADRDSLRVIAEGMAVIDAAVEWRGSIPFGGYAMPAEKPLMYAVDAFERLKRKTPPAPVTDQ